MLGSSSGVVRRAPPVAQGSTGWSRRCGLGAMWSWLWMVAVSLAVCAAAPPSDPSESPGSAPDDNAATPDGDGGGSSRPGASAADGLEEESRADGPSEPAARDHRHKAQVLLAEGNALASQGDFAEALNRYEAAYEEYPSVKLLLNIGTSLRHLGRNAEAAATYRRYLTDPEANPARITELKQLLEDIEQEVGWLLIEIQPVGASLRVDGKRVATGGSAHSMQVDPGEHTVIVAKPGFATTVRTIEVARRQRARVSVELSALEEAAPTVLQVSDGTAHRPVAYVLGGVGLAGLVASAIFGGLAVSTDSEADEHCWAEDTSICDAEGADLAEQAQTQATLATALAIGGGALLAAGVVVWLTAPAEGVDDGVTVGLRLDSRAGLSLQGRW